MSNFAVDWGGFDLTFLGFFSAFAGVVTLLIAGRKVVWVVIRLVITSNATANPMITTTIDSISVIGTHSGESTQTHDQLMTPHSFSVINTIARRPKNPILTLAREALAVIVFFGIGGGARTRTVNQAIMSRLL